MKTLIFVSTFAFSFSSSSWAVVNFTGHWMTTSGTVSSNVGFHSDCKKIEIVIEQTDTQFLTKTYHSECGLMGSDWGPDTMQLQGNKVFQYGGEVGSISDDTLLSDSPDSGVDYAWNLKMIVGDDGQPAVQTYYGVQNGVGAFATEGILHKVP